MGRMVVIIVLIGAPWLSMGQIVGLSKADRLFVITLDGFRWQEMFGGAVDSMMNNETLCPNRDAVYNKFHADGRIEARQKLLPWFWSTVESEGQLYGNRWAGSKMSCSNRYWFSYPGYNEILTGYSDPAIDSNDKIYNKNITILEYLNHLPDYTNQVAAFGSWDVFPYIINDKRSGIPVNAGFRKAEHDNLTHKEKILNELQDEIPSPWPTVRLDAFTHHYMMEYLSQFHPKVVYVSYGETDDFAHDGRYDHYLQSAHQTDRWIEELWLFIQSDTFYQNRTALLITTDHGRGFKSMEDWKSHGTIYHGSNEIWLAAIGAGIPARGQVQHEGVYLQSQVASTALALLGLEYNSTQFETQPKIAEIMDNNNTSKTN